MLKKRSRRVVRYCSERPRQVNFRRDGSYCAQYAVLSSTRTLHGPSSALAA